jgi:hypothetical protein
MARWVDIPAMRVLVLDESDSPDDWERLDKDSRPCPRGEVPALYIRRRDGKIFRPARISLPIEGTNFSRIVLEEV